MSGRRSLDDEIRLFLSNWSGYITEETVEVYRLALCRAQPENYRRVMRSLIRTERTRPGAALFRVELSKVERAAARDQYARDERLRRRRLEETAVQPLVKELIERLGDETAGREERRCAVCGSVVELESYLAAIYDRAGMLVYCSGSRCVTQARRVAQ